LWPASLINDLRAGPLPYLAALEALEMVSFIPATIDPQYSPLVRNSSGINHRCSARSIYNLAVDFLLYGDHGIYYRNFMPLSHPKLEKTYLQGSFRFLWYRDTVL